MRLFAPLLLLAIVIVGVYVLDETRSAIEADLVIVNRSDPFTLDPQRITYLRDMRMAAGLYEGLVRCNNHDFSIEPAAAEALPVASDDGRTYTFRIAPKARWSNGDPVTAHDFVFTLRRALLPDTASYYSGLLFAIEGAREFFDWRSERLAEFVTTSSSRRATESHGAALRGASGAQELWMETLVKFEEVVGIKALDERTLQITLEQPVPYFLDILAMPIAFPVHEATVSAHQRLDARTGRLEERQEWCKAGALVGNGPYVLARWRFKRDMLLVRNPHYHRPEIVRNDSVLALTIEDANTAVLAFKARGSAIDWMDEIGVDYAPDMLAGDAGDIHSTPAFATEFYSFNCRPTLAGSGGARENPFADARVRRAFALAIDRERIVAHVTRLNEPVARTLIPPGSIPGYRSPRGIGFDVQQARQELRDAGWFDRDGAGSITNDRGEPFPVVDLLWTTSAPRHRWITLEMKAQLEQNLGVQVEVRGLDARFYREDLRRGNFMLARGSWYGDYGDPTTFLDLSRTEDGNNHRRYSNPYVDDLLDQAAMRSDPQQRLRLLEEVERFLFNEEVPMLVLLHPVRLSMYHAGRLEGVSSHPRAIQYLWQMRRAGTDSPK